MEERLEWLLPTTLRSNGLWCNRPRQNRLHTLHSYNDSGKHPVVRFGIRRRRTEESVVFILARSLSLAHHATSGCE